MFAFIGFALKYWHFGPSPVVQPPFFLVWGHVINNSKWNFVSSPLHRKDISCHRWRGNHIIEKWPQDFHKHTFCMVFEIWLFQRLFPITTLKHTDSKTQPFKVPFEYDFREKFSYKILEERPQYYKSNKKKGKYAYLHCKSNAPLCIKGQCTITGRLAI